MPVHHLNTNNPDFYGYEQVGLNANQVRLLPTSQSKNVTATTIDAEDHTLFGAPVEGFEEQTKDNQDKALNSTADLIIKNHGAKKFFLIPEKKIMKDFTPPNEPMVTGQRFDRVLYANVADLRDGASKKWRNICSWRNN
ncbi:MAG: hypothetical protein HWD59_07370 [Coxiellaceae bacterium]|nr:MAG: hypothetical protein HWD59_07370 [Coxiellaceae bacterium]